MTLSTNYTIDLYQPGPIQCVFDRDNDLPRLVSNDNENSETAAETQQAEAGESKCLAPEAIYAYIEKSNATDEIKKALYENSTLINALKESNTYRDMDKSSVDSFQRDLERVAKEYPALAEALFKIYKQEQQLSGESITQLQKAISQHTQNDLRTWLHAFNQKMRIQKIELDERNMILEIAKGVWITKQHNKLPQINVTEINVTEINVTETLSLLVNYQVKILLAGTYPLWKIPDEEVEDDAFGVVNVKERLAEAISADHLERNTLEAFQDALPAQLDDPAAAVASINVLKTLGQTTWDTPNFVALMSKAPPPVLDNFVGRLTRQQHLIPTKNDSDNRIALTQENVIELVNALPETLRAKRAAELLIASTQCNTRFSDIFRPENKGNRWNTFKNWMKGSALGRAFSRKPNYKDVFRGEDLMTLITKSPTSANEVLSAQAHRERLSKEARTLEFIQLFETDPELKEKILGKSLAEALQNLKQEKEQGKSDRSGHAKKPQLADIKKALQPLYSEYGLGRINDPAFNHYELGYLDSRLSQEDASELSIEILKNIFAEKDTLQADFPFYISIFFRLRGYALAKINQEKALGADQTFADCIVACLRANYSPNTPYNTLAEIPNKAIAAYARAQVVAAMTFLKYSFNNSLQEQTQKLTESLPPMIENTLKMIGEYFSSPIAPADKDFVRGVAEKFNLAAIIEVQQLKTLVQKSQTDNWSKDALVGFNCLCWAVGEDPQRILASSQPNPVVPIDAPAPAASSSQEQWDTDVNAFEMTIRHAIGALENTPPAFPPMILNQTYTHLFPDNGTIQKYKNYREKKRDIDTLWRLLNQKVAKVAGEKMAEQEQQKHIEKPFTIPLSKAQQFVDTKRRMAQQNQQQDQQQQARELLFSVVDMLNKALGYGTGKIENIATGLIHSLLTEEDLKMSLASLPPEELNLVQEWKTKEINGTLDNESEQECQQDANILRVLREHPTNRTPISWKDLASIQSQILQAIKPKSRRNSATNESPQRMRI